MSGRVGIARTEAEALLADLLAAGSIPLVEDGRLRIETPGGVLDQRRRERLAGCLPELRAIVEGRWRSREECRARRPCRRMGRCVEPADGRWCKADPTCCLCGAPLPAKHRYLCAECVDERAEVDQRRWASRDGAA